MESLHFKKPLKTVLDEPPLKVVLIGPVSSGKTTIFNRLTGSTEQVCAGTGSVTRSLATETTLGGELLLVDTPGLGAQTGKLQNAIQLRQALQQADGVHALIFQ